MYKFEIATIIAYMLTILGIPLATIAGPYQIQVFIYMVAAGICTLALFKAHLKAIK